MVDRVLLTWRVASPCWLLPSSRLNSERWGRRSGRDDDFLISAEIKGYPFPFYHCCRRQRRRFQHRPMSGGAPSRSRVFSTAPLKRFINAVVLETQRHTSEPPRPLWPRGAAPVCPHASVRHDHSRDIL